MSHDDLIISAIDTSPLNRGLRGVDWLANEHNVPIVQDSDVALFDYESNGIYQVHFLFSSRGRKAIDRAKAAFTLMFDRYGADLIMGMVPEMRRDVKLLARWAGGKFVGKRETVNGPCELFILSREMWSNSR